MQRSLLLFKNSIHTEETYRVYKYELDRFITYFKLRDYNSLKSMDAKMLQIMIEDYVMEKKSKGRSRSTIKTPLSALELFCDTNDLMLNWKKIRRLLPAQKKKSGSKPYRRPPRELSIPALRYGMTQIMQREKNTTKQSQLELIGREKLSPKRSLNTHSHTRTIPQSLIKPLCGSISPESQFILWP